MYHAGQIQAGVGSVTAPGFSFTNDTNTGMYSRTADELNFTTGGTEELRITSNQILSINNGTSALPAFSFANDNDTGMYRQGVNAIGFATNGTEDFRITDAQAMSVNGGTAALPAFSFTADNDTGMYRIGANRLGFSTASTLRMELSATGTVIIANLGGVGTRYVYASSTGLLTATAAIPSDERLKKDITPITGALDAVKQINGVTFKWKDEEAEGTDTKVGFIAQNVMEAYPNLAAENPDGFLGVKYNEFSALLIEAIKEQQTIIEELKARIEVLESN